MTELIQTLKDALTTVAVSLETRKRINDYVQRLRGNGEHSNQAHVVEKAMDALQKQETK